MNRRGFALGLIFVFLFISLPKSWAIDIPLLTWERGKTQNIVVSGGASTSSFSVRLLSEKNAPVQFTPSKANKRGFVVYSGDLPENLPLGNYSIYVFGDASKSGSLIAEVKVIGIEKYNILESSKSAGLLGILITFILVFLSSLKSRKYTFLQFFRHKKYVEDGSILYEKNVPRFAYRTYLMRAGALNSFKPSLFKFLMEFDDTFLHKLSPLVWTFLPVVGLLAGIQGGIATGSNLPNLPIYSLLLLSLLSIVDAYTGIFVLAGFSIGQIVMGEVMTIRSVIEISALSLAWISTGLFSTYMYLVAHKELVWLNKKGQHYPAKFVITLASSTFSVLFFTFALLLVESTSKGGNIPRNLLFSAAVIVGIAIAIKIYIHESLDLKIMKDRKSDSLEEYLFHVREVISRPWAFIITAGSFITAFIWTEDWKLALLIGILNLIYFVFLFININIRPLKVLMKVRRSIFVETVLFTGLVVVLFYYIETLPLQSRDRSFLFLVTAFILPIVHRIFGNVSEAPIDEHLEQS